MQGSLWIQYQLGTVQLNWLKDLGMPDRTGWRTNSGKTTPPPPPPFLLYYLDDPGASFIISHNLLRAGSSDIMGVGL